MTCPVRLTSDSHCHKHSHNYEARRKGKTCFEANNVVQFKMPGQKRWISFVKRVMFDCLFLALFFCLCNGCAEPFLPRNDVCNIKYMFFKGHNNQEKQILIFFCFYAPEAAVFTYFKACLPMLESLDGVRRKNLIP